MADETVITATTRVDNSGLREGMDQAVNITRADLAVMQGNYKIASDAIRQSVASIVEAETQAAAFIETAHEAMADGLAKEAAEQAKIAATYQATADTERAALDSVIQKQTELAVSIKAAKAALDGETQSVNLASVTARAFAQEAGLPMTRIFGTLATQATGLAPLLNAAFPYVAAAGLAEVAYTLWKRFDPLTAAIKAFDEEAKKSDEQLKEYAANIRSVNREINELKYGKAAGDALDLAQSGQQLQTQRNLLQIKEQQIAAQQALIKLVQEGGHVAEVAAAVQLKGLGAGTVTAAVPGQFTRSAIEDLKTLRTQKAEIERQLDEDTQKQKLEAIKIKKELLDSQIAANNAEIAEANREASALKAAAREKAEGFRLQEDQIIRDEENAAREEKRIQEQRTQEFKLQEDQQLREEEQAEREAKRIQKETDREAIEQAKHTAEQQERIAKERAAILTEAARAESDATIQKLDLQKDEISAQKALAIDNSPRAEIGYLQQLKAIDQQIYAEKVRAQFEILQTDEEFAALQKIIYGSESLEAAEADRKVAADAQRLAQIQIQQQQAVAKDTLQIQQQQEAGYKQLFNQINTGFTRAFDSMITGQKNWAQQFQNIVKQLELSFVNTLINMALKFAEQELLMTVVHTANQQAQVGATAVATAQKTAITAAATLKDITNQAVQAAANTYAAVSVIPVIGPVLAPIAAAGAFAGVEALGALASFEVGTNYVPRTGNYQLHEGEAVVPKKYNPGTGSGDHFHYHASPGASPADRKQDIDQSFAHFKKQARVFNR